MSNLNDFIQEQFTSHSRFLQPALFRSGLNNLGFYFASETMHATVRTQIACLI